MTSIVERCGTVERRGAISHLNSGAERSGVGSHLNSVVERSGAVNHDMSHGVAARVSVVLHDDTIDLNRKICIEHERPEQAPPPATRVRPNTPNGDSPVSTSPPVTAPVRVEDSHPKSRRQLVWPSPVLTDHRASLSHAVGDERVTTTKRC